MGKFLLKMNGETVEKAKITTKVIDLCGYCYGQVPHSKIIKCSVPNCALNICKGCATIINNKAFCPACILKIVRRENVIIFLDRKSVKKYIGDN